MHQGEALRAVDVLRTEFLRLLLQQADRVRPHVVVGVALCAGVAPLGHTDKVSASAAGAVKLLVALVVAGMGILCHIVLGQIGQHPVQRLAGALGIVHDDLLVGMAEGLVHVLGEDVVRVILLRALVQEELGVVGGEVAGVVVILFPGLHFAADDLQALIGAVQRGGGARLAGADDEDVRFLRVGDLSGQIRLIAEPRRLVVHELVFGDAERADGTDHQGRSDVSVALLYDILLGVLRRLGVRIGAAVRLGIAGGEDVVPGDVGVRGDFRRAGAAGAFRLRLNLAAEQAAGRKTESACRGTLQKVTTGNEFCHFVSSLLSFDCIDHPGDLCLLYRRSFLQMNTRSFIMALNNF